MQLATREGIVELWKFYKRYRKMPSLGLALGDHERQITYKKKCTRFKRFINLSYLFKIYQDLSKFIEIYEDDTHTICPPHNYLSCDIYCMCTPKVGRLHLSACKYALGVKSSTNTDAVYSELGRIAVQSHHHINILKFHNRLSK